MKFIQYSRNNNKRNKGDSIILCLLSKSSTFSPELDDLSLSTKCIFGAGDQNIHQDNAVLRAFTD